MGSFWLVSRTGATGTGEKGMGGGAVMRYDLDDSTMSMSSRPFPWSATCVPAVAGAVLLLGGCGGSPMTPATAASPAPANVGTALSGNWLLSGSLPNPGVFPSPDGLAVTLDVQGNVVTGTADLQTTCAGDGTGFSGTYALTGTMQTDGSFAATMGLTKLVVPVLTVTGKAPLSDGATWAGNYTFKGSLPSIGTGPACVLDQSASFQATPIADVTGVYTGTVTSAGGGVFPIVPVGTNGTPLPATTLNLAVTLQQGATLHEPGRPLDGVQTRFGLAGSIQVTGMPCFTKGVISTTQPSEVAGSAVSAAFLMDDGSTFVLSLAVADGAATSLNLRSSSDLGGACAGVYFFPISGVLRR